MQTALTGTGITLLALDVDESITLYGGCIIDPITGTKPTTGFAVYVRGAEHQYRRRPTVSQIRSWIHRDARPLLVGFHARGYRPHLDAWVGENGVTCLGVSIVVPTLDAAIALCRQWRQRAVLDLSTNGTYFIFIEEQRDAA